MKCNFPVFIQAPYKHPMLKALNFKKYPDGITVPCGKCLACRKARARMWVVRCLHELRYWKESMFVTLTYDDKHLPKNKSLSKNHLQLFFKRLRSWLKRKKINCDFKYFSCGEYGSEQYTKRPHYHIIFFGLGSKDLVLDILYNCVRGSLKDCWENGNVNVGDVNVASVSYCVGYMIDKMDGSSWNFPLLQEPFQLASKGIGLRWCLENSEKYKADLGIYYNGSPMGLPRYYKKILELDSSLFKDFIVKTEFKQIKYYLDQIDNVSDLVPLLSKAHKQNEMELRAMRDIRAQRRQY